MIKIHLKSHISNFDVIFPYICIEQVNKTYNTNQLTFKQLACFVCHPVSLRLVEKMLNDRFPQQSSRDVPVTIFQLWTYLEANKVTDVEKHMSELAKEGIARMFAVKLHYITLSEKNPWNLRVYYFFPTL